MHVVKAPVTIEELIKKLELKIDSSTDAECKADFKLLAVTLAQFVGENDPTILQEGLEDGVYLKKFLKLVANTALDAMNPFGMKKTEKKFSKFLGLFPIIQKYIK